MSAPDQEDHAPLPWSADESGLLVRSADGEVAGVMRGRVPRGGSGLRLRANVRCVLRAVNAYPDLIAALRDLLALAERELDPDRQRLFAGVLVRARAVLADAKAEAAK